MQIIVVQHEDSLDAASQNQLASAVRDAHSYVHEKEVGTRALRLLRRLSYAGKPEEWFEISSPRDLRAVVEKIEALKVQVELVGE